MGLLTNYVICLVGSKPPLSLNMQNHFFETRSYLRTTPIIYLNVAPWPHKYSSFISNKTPPLIHHAKLLFPQPPCPSFIYKIMVANPFPLPRSMTSFVNSPYKLWRLTLEKERKKNSFASYIVGKMKIHLSI